MHLGVKAVFALSFERIHATNLINFGILPLHFQHRSDYDNLEVGYELEIMNPLEDLVEGEPLAVTDYNSKSCFQVVHDLSELDIEMILSGGFLNWYRQ